MPEHDFDSVRQWQAEFLLQTCRAASTGDISPAAAAAALVTAGIDHDLMVSALNTEDALAVARKHFAQSPAAEAPRDAQPVDKPGYYAERFGNGDLSGLTSRHGPFTTVDEAVIAMAAKAPDGNHDVEVWCVPQGRKRLRMTVREGRLSDRQLADLRERDTDPLDPKVAESVLPPGCRLKRSGPGAPLVVMGRDGMALIKGLPDERTAAEEAWALFGAFMSREDYETLAAADLREEATAKRLDDALAAIRGAHLALDVAGTSSDGTLLLVI